MTNRDLTDEDKQQIEDSLKRIETLNASTGVEAFDGTLTEEDQKFLNQMMPNDPFKDIGGSAELENDPIGSQSGTLELSYEDWQSMLVEKYQNLVDISNEELPGLWPSLEFELSVKTILNVEGCTLPFAGILLGPPGAKKTLGLQLFKKLPNTFWTDSFSPRAFVSHSTTVSKDKLPDIDMLPKIKDKFFLTPELAPIFGRKDEELQELLSMITRILDGHGFESDTGAHGHRGYAEDIMFTWVGAAVDIPGKVHKFLGSRGAKLYFYRLPLIKKSDKEYMDEMIEDNFDSRVKKTEDALIDYMNTFNACPIGVKQKNLIKIPWDSTKDDKESLGIIRELGKLLAHFRGVVQTWENNEDYEHAFATIEDPQRAMIQLRNLARGHALSQGRNYITKEDMRIVIETVFSTASMARVRIFELLLEFKGEITTSQIVQSLKISDDTARRTMTEFEAIGLVEMQEVQGSHGGEPQKQIILVEEFGWFLSEEFRELKNSHSARKYPCVSCNQNHDYQRSILLNSVLPRTNTHTPFFLRSGDTIGQCVFQGEIFGSVIYIGDRNESV